MLVEADREGHSKSEKHGDGICENPKMTTEQFLQNLAGAEILKFSSGAITYAFWTGFANGQCFYAQVFDHPNNTGWIARVLPPKEGQAHLAGFWAGFWAINISDAITILYMLHQSMSNPEPDMEDEDEPEENMADDKDELSADNYAEENAPEIPPTKLTKMELKRRIKQAEAEIRQGLIPDTSYWDGYIRGLKITHGEKYSEREHQDWLNLTTGDSERVALIVGFHDGHRCAEFEDAKKHLQETLINMTEFTDAIAAKLAEKTARPPKKYRQRMFVMDGDDDKAPPDTLH